MTRKDAAALMARLAAAYVGTTIGADTIEVFYGSCLETIDPELGLQIVQQIIATDKHFPRPARFNEVRRAIQRGHQEPQRELEAGPITDEERENVRKIIAETKRIVADARRR